MEALETFADEVPVATSGTAANALLVMFCRVCHNLRLNVLVCYEVRMTVCLIVCCFRGSANIRYLFKSVFFKLLVLDGQSSLVLSGMIS